MSKFETIGNATLIVYEGKNNNPLLATDVWLEEDNAYFGSWYLSHKVPERQRDAISRVPFIFISHFHPDHLNLKSLSNFKNATILIAQHYGKRVENDLRNSGFKVINLPPRQWIDIGKFTRIMLFSNEIQDSILLVEIQDSNKEKSLLINLNDSAGMGSENEIAKISSKYKNSFYLGLHCYGDADMINYFDCNNKRIEPIAKLKLPLGPTISAGMKKFNCNYAIPFSSFHQYARRDSFWANQYTTPLEDYSIGFNNNPSSILLNAFQTVIFEDGKFIFQDIDPEEVIFENPIPESKFGDDWDVKLNKKDIQICRQYFEEIKNLKYNFKSISVTVGGVENIVHSGGKGITKINFEVPRFSLIRAIKNEIFDDLLIGNFMKTKLVNSSNLYDPDFTFTTAKYADNGGVKKMEELKEYFAFYNDDLRRAPKDKFISFYKNFKNEIKVKLPYEITYFIKKILNKIRN